MNILLSKMQLVSFWASQNVALSRWILAIGMILLNSIAGFIGLLLYDMDIIVPFESVWVILGVIFLASYLYPNKKAKYKIRKSFDLILFGSIALGFLCLSNQESALIEQEESEILEEITIKKQEKNNVFLLVGNVYDNSIDNVIDNVPKDEIRKIKPKKLTKIERTKVRAFYKEIIKEIRKTTKTKKLPVFVKILLTLASVCLLLVLWTAILIISCELACSGYGAASLIVLLFGFVGSILGFVVLLKLIWDKKKEEKAIQEVDEPTPQRSPKTRP